MFQKLWQGHDWVYLEWPNRRRDGVHRGRLQRNIRTFYYTLLTKNRIGLSVGRWAFSLWETQDSTSWPLRRDLYMCSSVLQHQEGPTHIPHLAWYQQFRLLSHLKLDAIVRYFGPKSFHWWLEQIKLHAEGSESRFIVWRDLGPLACSCSQGQVPRTMMGGKKSGSDSPLSRDGGNWQSKS